MLDLERVVDVRLGEPVLDGAEVVIEGIDGPDSRRFEAGRSGLLEGLADRVGPEEPVGGGGRDQGVAVESQLDQPEQAQGAGDRASTPGPSPGEASRSVVAESGR